MKQSTLKNIEHLQQAINVQQTCAATICTYINNILPCITKLEQTVLELQKWITTDHNRVQLNAPNYDPDIDGPQPPPQKSQAEDHTTEESTDPIYHNSEKSHGYEDFPSDIQINTTAPHQTTTEYSAGSEEIPELEEDCDNGQFADAEFTLNTHSEST